MNIELYVMKTLGLDIDEAISHIEECKYIMNNSRLSNAHVLDDYSIPRDCEYDVMDYHSPYRGMQPEQFVAYVMCIMNVSLLSAVHIIESCKDELKHCDPMYDDVDDIIESNIDGLNSDYLLDILSYEDDESDDDLIHEIYRWSQDYPNPKEFVERWTEYRG
jgi:hypothetical protein